MSKGPRRPCDDFTSRRIGNLRDEIIETCKGNEITLAISAITGALITAIAQSSKPHQLLEQIVIALGSENTRIALNLYKEEAK